MALFSRFKDVATGKVYRQNTLINAHAATFLERSLENDNPFVQKWAMAAIANMETFLDFLLFGEGESFSRFRDRVKELTAEDTSVLAKTVFGFFFAEFVQHDEEALWDKLGISQKEFRLAIETIGEFSPEDTQIWREWEGHGEEEASAHNWSLFVKMRVAAGIAHDPKKDVVDSVMLNGLLTKHNTQLLESLEKEKIQAQAIALGLVPTVKNLESAWSRIAEHVPDEIEGKARLEQFYLMIFTNDLAIYSGLDGEEQEAVRNEYQRIWAANSPQEVDVIRERFSIYAEAVFNPHPENGASWSVAKSFVELCGLGMNTAILMQVGGLFEFFLEGNVTLLKKTARDYRIAPTEE